MIPYLVLIFIPTALLFASVYRQKGKMFVALGSSHEIQNNSLLIPSFFIIFFILLVLRNESVGVDIWNYKKHFELISTWNFRQVLTVEGDTLYYIFNWLVSRFTQNFRAFLAIVSAAILLPIATLYAEDRKYGFLKMIIFMNMPIFIMIFSGLRQALAFSIGVIAYKYVREKKLWRFLLCALIALGFHHSGFVVFSFYPLYHTSFKRKHLLLIVPIIGFVYLFNERIFELATEFLTLIFGEDYSAEIFDTGAYTMLILFILFAVLSYVLPDETLMDKETLGLRNYLLMAVVLQCFVPLNQLAMRLNYYYLIFLPVLIPKILKCCKQSFQQIAMISNWAISGYFLIYYLDKLYTGCTTGISSLNTYPYVFFWQ